MIVVFLEGCCFGPGHGIVDPLYVAEEQRRVAVLPFLERGPDGVCAITTRSRDLARRVSQELRQRGEFRVISVEKLRLLEDDEEALTPARTAFCTGADRVITGTIVRWDLTGPRCTACLEISVFEDPASPSRAGVELGNPTLEKTPVIATDPGEAATEKRLAGRATEKVSWLFVPHFESQEPGGVDAAGE